MYRFPATGAETNSQYATWEAVAPPRGGYHSLQAFRNESGHLARMLISVVPAGLEVRFFAVGRPLPPGA